MMGKRIGILLTLMVCAAGPGAAQDLESRIQRLEDIHAIERLLLDYGRFLDARDFESYGNLFAEDGAWIGGFGRVQGPMEIQRFMEEAIPGANTGNTYHLLSNFVIDVDGDTAMAWSRWAFVTGGDRDTPTIVQGGHYEDRLVRDNGEWKFQRREAVLDIPVDFSPN